MHIQKLQILGFIRAKTGVRHYENEGMQILVAIFSAALGLGHVGGGEVRDIGNPAQAFGVIEHLPNDDDLLENGAAGRRLARNIGRAVLAGDDGLGNDFFSRVSRGSSAPFPC